MSWINRLFEKRENNPKILHFSKTDPSEKISWPVSSSPYTPVIAAGIVKTHANRSFSLVTTPKSIPSPIFWCKEAPKENPFPGESSPGSAFSYYIERDRRYIYTPVIAAALQKTIIPVFVFRFSGIFI